MMIWMIRIFYISQIIDMLYWNNLFKHTSCILLMNEISRREFLNFCFTTPFFFQEDGISEENLKLKARESKKLSLENMIELAKISDLKNKDFSLHYGIFRDMADFKIGTAYVNFSREKRVMDIKIDFNSITEIYLWTSNIFSSVDYKKILQLEKMKFYSEFNDNFKWTKYVEGAPINKKDTEIIPKNYENDGSNIMLDGKVIVSGKKYVYNPISALFDVLNGQKIQNFAMVTGGEIADNIKIDYAKEKNLVIATMDFPLLVVGSFKKVYAILYNNIPVSGYIQHAGFEKGEDPIYLRGELEKISIDKKEILLGKED